MFVCCILLQCLEAKLRQKKLFREDILPESNCNPVAKKLRTHEKKEQALLEQVRVLNQRELHINSLAQPDLDKSRVVGVAETEDDERQLILLGLKTVLWTNTTEQYQSLLEARDLVWFCRAAEVQDACFLASESCEVSGFVMATRLLGGFLGTDEWCKVCLANCRVIQPPARLKPALWERMELCFHKSLEANLPDAARAIARAVEASVKVRKPSLWRLRSSWKEVKCKNAFILIAASILSCEHELKKLKKKAFKEQKLGNVGSAVHLLQTVSAWV